MRAMKKLIIVFLSILFSIHLNAQWKDINPNPPHNVGLLTCTHFFSKDFGYIQVDDTAKKAHFYYTEDAGDTWTYKFKGAYTLNFVFLNPDTFFQKAGDYFYTCFGDSLELIYTFSDKINTGHDELYLGKNHDLYINCYKSYFYPDSIGTYRSTDYGFSWYKVSDTAINKIAFINDSTGFGQASFYNQTDRFLMKSTDAGKSWLKVENTQYGADFYFNEDTFYTSFGTYLAISIDGGKSWNEISNGLPKDLELHNFTFINTTTGFIYSWPYGLYKTIDAGKNWELLWDQAPHSFSRIQCLQENGKVYIILSEYNQGTSNIYYGVYDSSEIWTTSTSQMLPLEKQFSVFPNPASHEINISYSGFISAGTEAGLYNVQGQLLQKITLNMHKNQMDISSLPKGVYLLKINTERGLWVEKIVKE